MNELFPLARDTDPETSHEAAEAIVSSGRADTHRQIVLELVRRNRCLTYAELYKSASEDEKRVLGGEGAVWRRISDLLKMGKIRRVAQDGKHIKRQCSVHHTTMTIYEATQP